ncbi:hypothetical protein ACEWAY_24445, partial [Vibrio parahaemolyticus]
RTLAAASAALLTALVLTACTPTAAAPTTPSPVPTGDSAETPAATPTDTPDAEAADPTCETIILSSTAADFRSIGWKAQSEP